MLGGQMVGRVWIRALTGVGPLWLASLVVGLAGGAFPLAIAMFNLRSRTTLGSAAMAGFTMGVGYLVGTFGPLLGGSSPRPAAGPLRCGSTWQPSSRWPLAG